VSTYTHSLGKRPLYKKTKPSIKEMQKINSEIVQEAVKKQRQKEANKQRKMMLEKLFRKRKIINLNFGGMMINDANPNPKSTVSRTASCGSDHTNTRRSLNLRK